MSDQREVIERAGMWLVSSLGTSFVCRCGWRSGITDEDTADERLSAHIAEQHVRLGEPTPPGPADEGEGR